VLASILALVAGLVVMAGKRATGFGPGRRLTTVTFTPLDGVPRPPGSSIVLPDDLRLSCNPCCALRTGWAAGVRSCCT
jgi:hypothetical protein